MDLLGVGDHVVGGELGTVEGVDNAFGNFWCVFFGKDLSVGERFEGIEFGNVNAFEILDGFESFATRTVFHGAHAFSDFDDHVFAFADNEEVEEGSHRFGIEYGRSACEEEGRVIGAIGGAQGEAGEVDDGEDIGVGEFGLKRDADKVHFVERIFGLMIEEIESAVAQFGFHVLRGGIGAFAPAPVEIVEDGVEDEDADVSETEVVEIGEDEGHAELDVIFVFVSGVELGAEIAGGLFDVGQNFVVDYSTQVHGGLGRLGDSSMRIDDWICAYYT